jgi:PAS domain S-box-containing protein
MRVSVVAKKYVYILIAILIFIGLYLASLYSYLLFHSLAEIFSIVVACGIFVIAWNSRQFFENNYLLFIGIAYLFVGGLDLIHTLAYTGMGVFKGYETNLATQLWIAARYMQSISLLIAPLLFRRKLRVNLVFTGYALATSIFLFSIFYWDIFPLCFIEGVGLTPFKKISEYIISLILLGSIILLLKNRREFERGVLQWLVLSILFTIASEMAFTIYTDPYGLSNLIGHFFKIISFYLIYEAIIETGLKRPYDLLSQDLRRKEEALARLASFPELNPNPIAEIDLSGSVYYLNPAAKRLFPDLQTMGSKHMWLADFGSLVSKFKQDSKASYTREVKIDSQWYQQAIHYAGGDRVRIYGLDITDQRKIEEELMKSRDELEIRVQERTAELEKTNLELGLEITERKQAEEQLKAASLYAKSLIEASLDPLVTISREGKIMDANRATELITGVHREQLIGSDFSDYFTEHEKAKKGYEEVFSKGFVTDYPLTIRNTSGKVTEVLYNATVYKNEHGEVQGVFAAARDITERKQIEESLREREALLRTVFETLPVGVWITDQNGVIIQGNQAGQQIWAGTRYVGIDQFGEYKGWWADTGKHIEPEEWAAARAVLKGETSINEEIEIECFDGSHKIILNSAVPIRNEKQEILGAFIINQDITERKRTEKAIRQMQKMEALGTLAGGIAHDFNNILMPIVINTELALLDTPDGSSITNYLKLVQEAANRGKDLTKQIITFSRQKEQVKAPIEIGPVIKEALKFLRSSIPKTIEIREHIEPAPSIILADPTQIHQVLMNLCSNASYAMREKGGILDVSLTPVEVDAEMVNRHLDLKPGPYLKLTVADTGQGMDKEIIEKIFDPFFTMKKPGEGTGMGLAVVHGIAKNHGGAITVYSEIGKGSTFNIFLPQIIDERKSETPPPIPVSGGKERILFIDDEEIQIRSVQPMLERLGYRVIAKTDALEALDTFRLKPDEFDLLITDQTMPRMTGRDLAQEILRVRPDIPIILCTGFSEVIHEEEAKAIGIREFIMKPFSMNEMAGIIRKSLKRNG